MPDHASRSASNLLLSSLTSMGLDMRLVFETPADGTELVRTLSGSNPPATVEVRFEPLTSTTQLVGQPTAWCNAPAPGQALVFSVPVTPSGTTTGELTVSSVPSGPTPMRIPITVKHGL